MRQSITTPTPPPDERPSCRTEGRYEPTEAGAGEWFSALSRVALENLLSALEVRFIAVSECHVASGHRLEIPGLGHPCLHYHLTGHGRISAGGGAPVELRPHTLVILPPTRSFCVDLRGGDTNKRARWQPREPKSNSITVDRLAVGTDKAAVVAICGFFQATYGASTGLFRELVEPIVEHFSAEDCVHSTLATALAELADNRVGSRAMSDALLKQVLVALIRRSLASRAVWTRRFALLRDPQIARAFGAMASDPGSAHTVLTLAKAASLGRSTFMVRFTAIVGETPMTVLRDLRMRRAAQYLITTDLAVAQVAEMVGYASRSSFVRAFQRAYRHEPSEYRAQRRGLRRGGED